MKFLKSFHISFEPSMQSPEIVSESHCFPEMACRRAKHLLRARAWAGRGAGAVMGGFCAIALRTNVLNICVCFAYDPRRV